MKIITLLGSPQKNGNTATVLGMFEDLIAKEHQVDRVNVARRNIGGCLGCGACQNTQDTPGCVQDDDMPEIFERMLQADVVVYASPLYCWSFSSQMKALIDRHFCLVTEAGTPAQQSLMEGKPIALLVTCAGPVENNADLVQVIFERMSGYTQARIAGKYVVPFCTTPDALGASAQETAKKMALEIAGIR